MVQENTSCMNPAVKIVLGVAALLCLLVCGVIGLGGWLVKEGVTTAKEELHIAQTESRLHMLEAAIDAYRLRTRALPATLDDLAGADGSLAGDAVPMDAWDRDFVYEPGDDGRSYTLRSFGADGAPGGEGVDADIVVEHGADE